MLVAVDDSEPAEAAARLAARLKNRCGGEVVLCSAVDTQDVGGPLVEEMLARAQALLERVGAHAALTGVAGELVEGEPVDAILRAATTRHADVIVIGSHGRRGLDRLFLGSVAESVVRRSPVPVLVVRT
jgi:nucleotide-binding universal stress UspA family protein